MILELNTACGTKKISGTNSLQLGVLSYGGINDPTRLIYLSWGQDILVSSRDRSVTWNWVPVSEVEAESIASSLGLRPGDFIIKTNGQPVRVSCSKFLGFYCSAKGLELEKVPHPLKNQNIFFASLPAFKILIPKGTSSLTVTRGSVGREVGVDYNPSVPNGLSSRGGTSRAFGFLLNQSTIGWSYRKEFKITGGKEIQLRILN